MKQLTNGQQACVLMFMPVVDISNIAFDYQFVFSVLDEFYVYHYRPTSAAAAWDGHNQRPTPTEESRRPMSLSG